MGYLYILFHKSDGYAKQVLGGLFGKKWSATGRLSAWRLINNVPRDFYNSKENKPQPLYDGFSYFKISLTIINDNKLVYIGHGNKFGPQAINGTSADKAVKFAELVNRLNAVFSRIFMECCKAGIWVDNQKDVLKENLRNSVEIYAVNESVTTNMANELGTGIKGNNCTFDKYII